MTKTSVSLIKINGKALEKLIGVISTGIGKLYKPTEIRKIADAEAYKIEVIERAKAVSKANSKEIAIETQFKIEERLAHQEAKRQLNIENVTFKAAEQLQNETDVSDELLDEDWIIRFFNTVQDVSNEEMQTLWSRILAGEIKRPKSFSLRTLEFLKNLSQEDAQLLTIIANYKLETGTVSNVLFYKPLYAAFEDKWNFRYQDFLYLIEIGILNPNDSVFLLDKEKEIGGVRWFIYEKRAIVFERESVGPLFEITLTPFTKIGNELLKLINKEPNNDYLNEFIKFNIRTRKDIVAKIGEEMGVENGEMFYRFEEE